MPNLLTALDQQLTRIQNNETNDLGKNTDISAFWSVKTRLS